MSETAQTAMRAKPVLSDRVGTSARCAEAGGLEYGLEEIEAEFETSQQRDRERNLLPQKNA